MEKKREGDREAAGEVFLSSDPLYHCFFGIGDGKGELLKLLGSINRSAQKRVGNLHLAGAAHIRA
jgi:hypothetical protein